MKKVFEFSKEQMVHVEFIAKAMHIDNTYVLQLAVSVLRTIVTEAEKGNFPFISMRGDMVPFVFDGLPGQLRDVSKFPAPGD